MAPAKKIKLPKAWQPPKKLPTKIGDCIDLALEARAQRKALTDEVTRLEKEEARVKAHLIDTFDKAEIEGARGKLGSASLSHKDVPQVKDKEKFGKWIAKHEAWDLLYGKATEEGCSERWQKGIEIDGVEKFHVVKVTLTDK